VSNAQVTRDVLDELLRDNSVDASRITVIADGDTVILGGTVDHVHQKGHAVEDARRVRGVREVIDNIDIDLAAQQRRDKTMSESNGLAKLTNRAQEAEQRAADAAIQARGDLEKSVAEARESAEAQAAQLKQTASASKDKISGWWDEQQRAWNNRVSKVREHLDEQKTTIDLVSAENRAEQAESDAKFAVDFAYSAIEEAEYAVLDAILAQADLSDALSRAKQPKA
jgi:hypothetical protein